MIRVYRIITIIIGSMASFYVLVELIDLISGNSSLNSFEDISILLFIICALFFSISFNIETTKHFKNETNDYEIIDAEKIKRNLKIKEFSYFILYGNLIIGFIIFLLMSQIIFSESLEDFLEDYPRLISILVIGVYGLIQVHFSIIVKRKLESKDS